MRKVVVDEWMSLDGVVQAPGAPEEDATGGFQHGGWHLRYFDEMSQKWVLEYLTEAGGFLLGRRTYESFAGYWPNASEEEQPVAQPLNKKPKYVASTTLSEPLEWENSSVLHGDVAGAVGGPEAGRWRRPPRYGKHTIGTYANRAGPGRRVPADDRPGHRGRAQAPLCR